jgi:heptosyltransferase II
MPKYRFADQNNMLVLLIKYLDTIGYSIFKNHNKIMFIDSVRDICFVQLASIGDFILMLPTLNCFKKYFNNNISVAVNSLNYEIAKKLSFIDNVYILDHPSFIKAMPRSRSSYYLYKTLKGISSDIIFESRGDSRIIPLIKLLTRHKYLVGFDAGGCGYLLDKILTYPFNEHITKTYERIFDIYNINDVDPIKFWDPNLLPTQQYELNINNFICVNIGVGATSKDWDWERFCNFIKLLAKDNYVIVIGRENDNKAKYYQERLSDLKSIKILINKTTVFESIYIIKNAHYYVGLDSGFTHIATLLGKRTLAIYSDSANYAVWKPIELYDNQITYIKKHLYCGNCGKLICADNICMSSILVEEVYNKFVEHF